jgi:hypothetical protein
MGSQEVMISMGFGKKAYEEMGRFTSDFLESVEPEKTIMKASFTSEIEGSGRWPSGMNMGSGTMMVYRYGYASGEWRGTMGTKEGDRVLWWATGRSKMVDGMRKGILLFGYYTEAEDLAWMNSVICIGEVETDMKEMRVRVHEWEPVP